MICPLCQEDWFYIHDRGNSMTALPVVRLRPGMLINCYSIQDLVLQHACSYLNGWTRFPEGSEL